MKLDLINGLKEGKKLSPRDLQMILIVVGLLLFVAVYFLVFNAYSDKNTELDKKIDERDAYLMELKGYESNVQVYKTSVEAAKKNIAANLARTPVGFYDEDFLLWMLRADEKIGSKLNSISFGKIDDPTEFKTYIGSAYKDVKGYRATATASMSIDYEQFKQYLEYIYAATTNFTLVNSATLTFNQESGTLSGVFSLSKYFIEYEGGVYTGEEGYDIPLGNPDPFHSKTPTTSQP